MNIESVLVRPCSGLITQPNGVNGFFSPTGYARCMYSDDPSYKDTDTVLINTMTAKWGVTRNNSIGDPTIRRYAALRFINNRNQDSDSGGDGYWCIRSNTFLIDILSILKHEAVTEPEDPKFVGMRIEIWLLDQYFDHGEVNWTNRAIVTESGLKITVYVSATLGDNNGELTNRNKLVIDLPDLADGSGPPKIYGCAVRVFPDPDISAIPSDDFGYAEITVQAYKMNARRGTEPETGIAIPPTLAPLWSPYLNTFLGTANGGYLGEWERGPYVPTMPFTFGRGNYSVRPLHLDVHDKMEAVVCSKNGSVQITLVAIDADQANGTLTYQKTYSQLYGSLSAMGPVVTYTPNPDFVGNDRFDFRVQSADGEYSYSSRVWIRVV
jgi:hypothetical protein